MTTEMASHGSRQGPYTIYVVDDDEATATGMTRLLGAAGFAVRAHASAAEFLATFKPQGAGCIILDVRLPDVSGLDLQKVIAGRDDPLPIIFLTGHAEVPDSVRAIQRGAIDFLTKPVDPHVLLDAVSRALAKDAIDRRQREREHDARALYERLTPREREVFAHLISGQLNKQVAADLQISVRTIKLHRARIFEKLQMDSIAGLTRLALELRIDPAADPHSTKDL
jgi:FixJ family two-component response regulator